MLTFKQFMAESINVSKTKHYWEINKIETPKHLQGKGHANSELKELLTHADKEKIPVALSPTSEFGSSKTRLTKWYRRHGFVPNKGRNKDFRTQQTMVRPNKERK